jgi:hypothetical protein
MLGNSPAQTVELCPLNISLKSYVSPSPLRKFKAKYDIFSTDTAHALVPVSIGLIVLSLILAFSSWIQDVLAFLWRQPGVIGLKIKMRRNRSQNRRAKEQAIIIERGMGGWGV